MNAAIMELGVTNRIPQQKLRPLDAILHGCPAGWTELGEYKQSPQTIWQATKQHRCVLIELIAQSTTQCRRRVPASTPWARLRYVKLKCRAACDEAHFRADI